MSSLHVKGEKVSRRKNAAYMPGGATLIGTTGPVDRASAAPPVFLRHNAKRPSLRMAFLPV
uniref:hypothetical protein n=1 Tax=Leclercia sp. TaxID=1898428 RepID=UPI002FDD62BD